MGNEMQQTLFNSTTDEKQPSSGIPLERLVIPFGGYKTIVVDPPWKYGKWGKASIAPRGSNYEPQDSIMPYDTMTLDEIKALPVGKIAAENCDLYLWTTQKYLPVSFEIFKECGDLNLNNKTRILKKMYNPLKINKENGHILF